MGVLVQNTLAWSSHLQFNEKNIGIIGEITPVAVENFKLRVPVAAFELNLSSLLKK